MARILAQTPESIQARATHTHPSVETTTMTGSPQSANTKGLNQFSAFVCWKRGRRSRKKMALNIRENRQKIETTPPRTGKAWLIGGFPFFLKERNPETKEKRGSWLRLGGKWLCFFTRVSSASSNEWKIRSSVNEIKRKRLGNFRNTGGNWINAPESERPFVNEEDIRSD